MRFSDVEEVSTLEKEIFSNPWSKYSIMQNLFHSDVCFSFVAEVDKKIAGYAFTWIVRDELHIGNIAVKKEMRRKKIAESLMKKIIEKGRIYGCSYAYLEVRKSNEAAISLYKKFGFVKNGVRKRYYPDNNEDAIIMFKYYKNKKK